MGPRGALAAVAVALLAMAVIGAVLLWDWVRGYEPDCDSYSFDDSEWADQVGDGREHQAEALAECRSLVGLTRQDVTAMLGKPAKRPEQSPRMRFSAGWVNDGIGPGDAQTLIVSFDSGGRVEGAELVYPQ